MNTIPSIPRSEARAAHMQRRTTAAHALRLAAERLDASSGWLASANPEEGDRQHEAGRADHQRIEAEAITEIADHLKTLRPTA